MKSYAYRHRRKKRPSLLRHIGAAALLLCLAPAGAAAFVYLAGDAEDARAKGYAALEAMPMPPPINDLAILQIGDALPDILDPADTAEGLAARSGTDILGRPINRDAGNSESGTSAPLATPQTDRTGPDSNAPKVVMIDGRPVSEGETAYIGGRPSSSPAPGQFVPPQGLADAPLTRAPIAGLSRNTPYGPVPAPSASGLTPLKAYAKPANVRDDARAIAIIIGGMGVNAARTQRAIDTLPPEVTLSFAAHVPGLQGWIDKARAKGHEVILELPMEPYNFDSANPQSTLTLRGGVGASENIRTLDRLLSRAQGYFAVTNYQGERFLDDRAAVDPVLRHISEAGLGFVYEGLGGSTALTQSAEAYRLSLAMNRATIDVDPVSSAVTQTLRALEGTASRKNTPLGMGFAYPGTIDAVTVWADELDARGITLVPASFLMLGK